MEEYVWAHNLPDHLQTPGLSSFNFRFPIRRQQLEACHASGADANILKQKSSRHARPSALPCCLKLPPPRLPPALLELMGGPASMAWLSNTADGPRALQACVLGCCRNGVLLLPPIGPQPLRRRPLGLRLPALVLASPSHLSRLTPYSLPRLPSYSPAIPSAPHTHF